MKITDIEIDCFGVWRDLSLRLSDSSVNVLYGPNESGKSTLTRFIRGILYGFRPAELKIHGARDRQTESKGTLRIKHNAVQGEINRAALGGGGGIVSITGFDDDAPAEDVLAGLLSDTSEAVFEHLFSIDLHELQEVATFNDVELADYVYGLTLGPEGRNILDALDHLDRQRRRLFDPDQQTGRLIDLLERDEQLSAEIRLLCTLRDQHTALIQSRDELTAEISERKARQSEIQYRQRGHRFLEQAWPIWNRIRKLCAELQELPVLSGFPENGLAQLSELDGEVESLGRCHKILLAKAGQLRDEALPHSLDAEFWKHAPAIGGLIDQRDRITNWNRTIADAESQADRTTVAFDTAVGRLGPEWSDARLELVDMSPSAQCRLIETAADYRTAIDHRSDSRRRYKLQANAYRQQAAELKEKLKSLGNSSIEELMGSAKRQAAALEELSRMRLQEAECNQRRAAISDRLARAANHPRMPRWAYLVLGLFGLIGVVFALIGVYTGLAVNGIVGLTYALLGTACGGTAYALRTHVEDAAGENVERLQDEFRDVEALLCEMREAITSLENDAVTGLHVVETGTGLPTSSGGDKLSMAELIARQAREITELQHLADTEQRIGSERHRLGECRNQRQTVQREVNAVRQRWCALLKQLGLNETVRIDEAFLGWQDVLEAKHALQQYRMAERELAVCRRPLDELQQSIISLANGMGWGDVDNEDPLTVLGIWHEQLENEHRQRGERRRLLVEAQRRLREAGSYRNKITKMKFRLVALLARGGASTRSEFSRRSESVSLRRKLDESLSTANAELDTVCRNHPELAIVEEDLIHCDPDVNAGQLEQMAADLEHLDNELEQLFENLGSIKQEIADCESDRRSTQLRFDRARIDDDLKNAAEQWFACQLAGRAVRAMRRKYERNHQPGMLAAASEYLTKLTGGRYQNIWAPLGERRLCVDDERQHSFSVEQLSGGTREQLFLAIRLAVVEELTRQGVELPMVLDDVLANFDQSRTEAVVDTLIEFASDGQQVLLLTCHQHLANMFDNRGAHTIWLPGSQPAVEQRKAG